MFRKIITATLFGVDAKTILVETDVQPGLPYLHLVGLADTTIREARERIRAAIVNSGFEYPKQRITINLSPAGLPKEGSHFDLPMAVGIMGTSVNLIDTDGIGFIGELSLDGKVKGIRGALPLVISMREEGVKKIILPMDNAQEVSILKDVEIYPVTDFKECMEALMGIKKISIYKRKEIIREPGDVVLDFAEVKGNENAKKALMIAAAGNHGILLIGSPGCGKTMMAKRMPFILPEMDYEEMLEVAKIHSVAGITGSDYILSGRRPFRAPHSTITKAAMLGGGVLPQPGEISLAHNGVLFLDELGEFNPSVIELLRQPVEEGVIHINRSRMEVDFPCRLMLVAASNPCKCGYLGDDEHICTCTPRQLESYYSKFSGPMLDRIDMHVSVNGVSEENLEDSVPGLSTAEMRAMVTKAVEIQRNRYKGTGINFNSRLEGKQLKKYCELDKDGAAFIRNAFKNMGLSMRSYNKLLKVARTIADLEGQEQIKWLHIAEAIQYRSIERFNRS